MRVGMVDAYLFSMKTKILCTLTIIAAITLVIGAPILLGCLLFSSLN